MKDRVGWIIIALLCIIGVVVALCLPACSGPEEDSSSIERFELDGDAVADYSVVMDRVTGVYYLVVISKRYDVAVTPLLNVDGLPLVSEDVNHGDVESALADVRANMQREMRGEL